MYSPHAPLVRRLAPRYAKAMDDLITPLPMPDTIASLAELRGLASVSPYFAEERSDEWRSFFNKLDPTQKSAATNKRRLYLFFSLARLRQLCVYCWLPCVTCMCEKILSKSAAVQNAMNPFPTAAFCRYGDESSSPAAAAGCCGEKPNRPECKVTFILHSQELLRMTNSAHIAALAMDASFLVWGLPEHDAKIVKLGRYWDLHPAAKDSGLGWPIANPPKIERLLGEEGTNNDGTAAGALEGGEAAPSGPKKGKKEKKEKVHIPQHRSETNSVARRTPAVVLEGTEDPEMQADAIADRREMSVLLYPAIDASVPFEELLAYRDTVTVPALVDQCTAAIKKATADATTGPATGDKVIDVTAGDKGGVTPSLHIYLSDGTWSQARVVNRQVNPAMPRVALEISPRYAALFHGLRKRTRESGVSTLEATTIAVSQSIAHDIQTARFGMHPNDTAMTTVTATETSSSTSSSACNSDAEDGDDAPKPEAKLGPVLPPTPTTIPSSVAGLESSLFFLMKQFVDIVSLISTKHDARAKQTTFTPAELKDIIVKETAYKVLMQRIFEADQVEPTPGAYRHLMPAPVCNYCYICDHFIGYERMIQHVAGKEHMRKVAEGAKYSDISAKSQLSPKPWSPRDRKEAQAAALAALNIE